MKHLILLFSFLTLCFSSQNSFAQSKKAKKSGTFTAKPAKVRDAQAPKQSATPSTTTTTTTITPDKTKKKKKKGFKTFWANLTKPLQPNRNTKTAKVRQRKTKTGTRDDVPPSFEDDIDNIAVLRTAKKYVGVPYVWGGSTPNGFDCSGFVQYVWREHGYNIPRTSKQQSSYGQSVSLSKVKAGDLVFFGDSKNDISHVGMISSTRGRSLKMIHASSSKGVSTIDINMSNYFKTRLQNARRIAR